MINNNIYKVKLKLIISNIMYCFLCNFHLKCLFKNLDQIKYYISVYSVITTLNIKLKCKFSDKL